VGTRNANNQGLGVVRNVSRTGIGIETGQPPLRGQMVILRLAIDDVTHELRTHAVRVQRRGAGNFYEVGLDWTSCTPEQLSFLDKILQLVETQPKS
jgi:hypothetical protein